MSFSFTTKGSGVIKSLTVVFGESKLNFLKMKNEDNSLCAIWATTKSNEITQTLDPASGNLVFPQEDNKIEIELEGLSENIDDLFYKLKPISLSLKTFADNSSFCELTKMILMDISGTSDIVPDYQKLQRRIIGINWSNKAHLANFMPRISNWLDKAKTCSILKNIS